jgi:hypothetical protein
MAKAAWYPFKWKQTRQPTAGAEAFAFQQFERKPIYAIQGRGTRTRNQPPAATQPPQVWASPLWTTAGYGGLQAGTIVLQPLDSGLVNPLNVGVLPSQDQELSAPIATTPGSGYISTGTPSN